MADDKLYLYPVWVRIWHGINALFIITLGVTGISMQYTSIEDPLIQFSSAVTLHNIAGILIVISYIFFFILNIKTENVKHYKIKLAGLTQRLVRQGRYYLIGYLRGEPKPYKITKDEKFNPLQKVSYFGAMYILIPLVVVTGLALLYPEVIKEKVFEWSGIRLTTFLHSLAGFFILIFLIIHLYVITIGKNPLKNFKSIIHGYHDPKDH